MAFFSATRQRKRGTASRLAAILAAARKTGHYGARRLDKLADADPISISFVRRHPELFHNANEPAEGLRDFKHPLQPPPNTLVLEAGFRQTAAVWVFASDWTPGLKLFRPGSVAASPHRLVSLAMSHQRPRLSHSVVAFVGPRFGVLTCEHRDLLWTAFGVPVYEQFRGLGNELLASECDAHDGLHIREDEVIFEDTGELLATSLTRVSEPVLRLRTGLRGRIVTDLCGCGEAGPRLAGLERFENTGPPLKAAAAAG